MASFPFRALVLLLLSLFNIYVTPASTQMTLCRALPLSQARAGLAAAVFFNKVYFAGGVSPTGVPSSRVDIFDITTQNWTTTELSSRRQRLSAVIIGSKLIFGPGDSDPTIDIYDATTDQWTNTVVPVPVAVACVVSIEEYLFVTTEHLANIYNTKTNVWSSQRIKGNPVLSNCAAVGNKVLLLSENMVEMYDVKEGSWTTVYLQGPSSPYTMRHSCVVNELALFAGMFEEMNIYHAKNNTWTTTPFPFKRLYISTTSIENRYCVFAGGMNPTTGEVYSRVDIYDTFTNQWTIKTLVAGRAEFGLVSVGEVLHFGGGETVWDDPKSALAEVTVFEEARFDISLSNITAHVGDIVSFNVTYVRGMTYEWRKNNVIWPWSKSYVLTTMPLVVGDDQSYYQLTFSDHCGRVFNSNIVFITIVPPDTAPLLAPTPTTDTIPMTPHGEDSNSPTWILAIIGGSIAVAIAITLYVTIRRRSVVSKTHRDDESLLQEIAVDEEPYDSSPIQSYEHVVIPFDEIKIGDKLGEGSYGEVLYGKWYNQTVALKRLKSSSHYNSDKTEALLAEAKTLKSLHHKHIVLLFGVTQNPKTDEMLLVMEYMRHGSLSRLLFVDKVVLAMPAIIRIALDVANGVDFLHHLTPKIIHRDLKSENVLLYRNKTRAKISDFGTARLLHDQSVASTVVGTLGYIAPEVLQQQPYDEKVDIFSFGVLLYELCTNTQMPVIFEEDTRLQKVHATLADTPLRELILTCCKNDSAERPTMTECIEKLHELKRNESLD